MIHSHENRKWRTLSPSIPIILKGSGSSHEANEELIPSTWKLFHLHIERSLWISSWSQRGSRTIPKWRCHRSNHYLLLLPFLTCSRGRCCHRATVKFPFLDAVSSSCDADGWCLRYLLVRSSLLRLSWHSEGDHRLYLYCCFFLNYSFLFVSRLALVLRWLPHLLDRLVLDRKWLSTIAYLITIPAKLVLLIRVL